MKKFIFVCIMISSLAANAQDDGDSLARKEMPTSPQPEAVIPVKEFRKREHSISVDYSNRKSVTKIKSAGTNSESDTQSIDLAFGYSYNMGRFQPGISIATSLSNNDSTKESSFTSSVGIGIRANFIENVPGEKLIPYVGFAMSILNVDTSTSAADGDLTGNGTIAAVGAEWYPFGEIFAFNASLSFGSLTGDGKAAGTSIDATVRQLGLNLGYTFAF